MTASPATACNALLLQEMARAEPLLSRRMEGWANGEAQVLRLAQQQQLPRGSREQWYMEKLQQLCKDTQSSVQSCAVVGMMALCM
jgi:hypothetical protein